MQTIHMPLNTWNLKLVNIQRTAREHRWDLSTMLLTPGINTTEEADLADLVRIPANSKSRFNMEEHFSSHLQIKHCNSFLGSVGINRDLTEQISFFKKADQDQDYHPPAMQAPLIPQNPEELAADLFQCTTSQDCTYTVEDKDPSILWRMKNIRIFAFWYKLMSGSPDRWEVQDIPDDTILKNYRGILDSILPRSLVGKSNAFSMVHVPYAYFTIKLKCFRNVTQLCCNKLVPGTTLPPEQLPPNAPHPAYSCKKPGHSCLRNIISFKKLPGRAAFKRIGRVFMRVVEFAVPGYGIRDLSRGKDIIETDLSQQFKRSPDSRHGCVRCGQHMKTPTLHTADAGQAYEMISPSRISRALRIIFRSTQILSRSNDPTVSCMHTPKAKTRFGGWIRDRLYDRSVYFPSKISHCVKSLIQLRWYKFGNRYLYQISGIPTGGPIFWCCS